MNNLSTYLDSIPILNIISAFSVVLTSPADKIHRKANSTNKNSYKIAIDFEKIIASAKKLNKHFAYPTYSLRM